MDLVPGRKVAARPDLHVGHQPPDFKTLRIEPWWLETSAGKSMLYVPPATADKPTTAVIFGQGNGELIDFWPNELAGFRRLIDW